MVEPFLWVLVVERPRWDNGERSEEGTTEADPKGKVNVSVNVSDEEADNLK